MAKNGSAPAITFYDGLERIELSYKSLDNWVSKTSNFLLDEVEVERTDTVYLDLPAHWLKVVWMLATWASGCQLSLARENAQYVISNNPIEGDDIYCSLQVMGKLPDPPLGFIDFITEVRRFGDSFSPISQSAEIEYEDRWRVDEFSRILISGEVLLPEQIAAAMDTHSTLVILRNATDESREKIEKTENVTVTWINQY